VDSTIVFITDLADQAVILPMIGAIAFALLLQGCPRVAGAWLGATVATFTTLLIFKLLFLTCTVWLFSTGIASPSGHAASAALLGGGMAATLGAGAVATAIVGIVAGSAIGATRLYLHLHTGAEVMFGLALGTLGATLLHRLAGTRPVRPRALTLLITVGGVVLTLHGRHMPAEPAIRDLAGMIRQALPICQPGARDFAATPPTCRPT
jgi:membrane-associated phospholipid phosphatase